MFRFAPLASLLLLTACAEGLFGPLAQPEPDDAAQTRPEARPEALAPPPPPDARSVEEFDTTTAAERAEAAAPPEPAGEQRLGVTVASLGSPAEPGFWLKTPLVSAPGKGRISFNGKSAQVELIPIAGAASAGSRISLAAMRLIEAPLTDLPEIEVFQGG